MQSAAEAEFIISRVEWILLLSWARMSWRCPIPGRWPRLERVDCRGNLSLDVRYKWIIQGSHRCHCIIVRVEDCGSVHESGRHGGWGREFDRWRRGLDIALAGRLMRSVGRIGRITILGARTRTFSFPAIGVVRRCTGKAPFLSKTPATASLLAKKPLDS